MRPGNAADFAFESREQLYVLEQNTRSSKISAVHYNKFGAENGGGGELNVLAGRGRAQDWTPLQEAPL